MISHCSVKVRVKLLSNRTKGSLAHVSKKQRGDKEKVKLAGKESYFYLCSHDPAFKECPVRLTTVPFQPFHQ